MSRHTAYIWQSKKFTHNGRRHRECDMLLSVPSQPHVLLILRYCIHHSNTVKRSSFWLDFILFCHGIFKVLFYSRLCFFHFLLLWLIFYRWSCFISSAPELSAIAADVMVFFMHMWPLHGVSEAFYFFSWIFLLNVFACWLLLIFFVVFCFLLLQSSPYAALLQLSPLLLMIIVWCVTSLLASDPLYSLRMSSYVKLLP